MRSIRGGHCSQLASNWRTAALRTRCMHFTDLDFGNFAGRPVVILDDRRLRKERDFFYCLLLLEVSCVFVCVEQVIGTIYYGLERVCGVCGNRKQIFRILETIGE